jgi:hypothetical protein
MRINYTSVNGLGGGGEERKKKLHGFSPQANYTDSIQHKCVINKPLSQWFRESLKIIKVLYICLQA